MEKKTDAAYKIWLYEERKKNDTTTLSFGEVRKSALQIWLNEMRRQRTGDNLDDIYKDSFECLWQSKYVTNSNLKDGHKNKYHNSIYCSLGDWCTQLSDWLSNDRFDHLHYNYIDREKAIEVRSILFRHHTVFLLIGIRDYH